MAALDTSVAISWIGKRRPGREVVAVAIDPGRGRRAHGRVIRRGRWTAARGEAAVVDARDEFAGRLLPRPPC